MASSRVSVSRVHVCLSSKLSPTCRKLVSQGTAQRGPHRFNALAPWFLKCGTQTSSISITSDLLEMPVLGPYPRPTETRNSRGAAQQSVFTSPSSDCDVHCSLGTALLDHSSSVPKRRQWWEPTNGRDPSAYLLANSRCKHNAEFGGLEAKGVGGEGWL